MKTTKQGIICPWCLNQPFISDCQHNPFKLMKTIEVLTESHLELIEQANSYRIIKKELGIK